MDIKYKILLNSNKNINSVNTDSYGLLGLSNNISNLTEYDLTKIISSNDVFEKEREENERYAIHGRLEYLSLLNGLDNKYKFDVDFFNPIKDENNTNPRNIQNSFDFYLVKPSKEFIEIEENDNIIAPQRDTIIINRKFEVIATPNELDIFNAGFSKNIFNEQTYMYICNKDIDIKDDYDALNFPITEVFLYARYKPIKNVTTNDLEPLFETIWDDNGNPTKKKITKRTLLNGDIINGDLIGYNDIEYQQKIITQQEYYITTHYNYNKHLIWKYNPFIPIRLRYLSDVVENVNINETRFDINETIPKHANLINDDYIWRDILQEGYVDVLSGVQLDNPFINNKRYVFSSHVLDITPDISDNNTSNVFKQIQFKDPKILNYQPNLDLNEFSKPC